MNDKVPLWHRKALNKKEAASLMGISPQTLSDLIMNGNIKAMKIGSSIKIWSTELDEFCRRSSYGEGGDKNASKYHEGT